MQLSPLDKSSENFCVKFAGAIVNLLRQLNTKILGTERIGSFYCIKPHFMHFQFNLTSDDIAGIILRFATFFTAR